MKSITTLRALVGAAILTASCVTCAAAHAATVNSVTGKLLFTTANFGRGSTSITVPEWTVTEGAYNALAFCIEPVTPMTNREGLTGSAFAGFADNKSVQRLFSVYYPTLSTASPAATALGFQLALWELYKDNGSLTSGSLAFGTAGNGSELSKAVLNTAAGMLATAQDSAIAIDNHFSFTRYTATGAQPVVTAMAISPVPEPATYAMFGAGLALVGWAARRRNAR
ncbi:PEP-CTERM sorting domain-containing protein [Pseudoduganella flava]|nr:PEP-CTERM sorting domain-containing protein [Pseudoduganella flava]